MIQKAFEIGNSTALTIPKKTGVKPGTKVKFTRKKNKLIYEIISDDHSIAQREKIKDTSAAFTLNSGNLQKTLKKLKEHQYDSTIRIS